MGVIDNVVLRFMDGLVVDPRDCPKNIPARSHWTEINGKAVCQHRLAEIAEFLD